MEKKLGSLDSPGIHILDIVGLLRWQNFFPEARANVGEDERKYNELQRRDHGLERGITLSSHHPDP